MSEEGRGVVEVLLERNRMAWDEGLRTLRGNTYDQLVLDPEMARLALETTASRGVVKMVVDGEERRTIVEDPTRFYANEVYVLNGEIERSATEVAVMPESLRQELQRLVSGWLDLSRQHGEMGFASVYDAVRDVLVQGGVSESTYVMVTRDPDGQVAAIGIYTYNSDAVVQDSIVTDARLRVSPRPEGSYWVGAGYENMLASLRDIRARFPDTKVHTTVVNTQSLRIDVNLYYSEDGEVPIFSATEHVGTYEAAQSSLMRRRGEVVQRAVAELRHYMDGRELPAEFGETLTDLSRQLETVTGAIERGTLEISGVPVASKIVRLKEGLAAFSQKVRLAQGDAFEDARFGNNIRFVDTTYRPASDAMVAAYASMLSRVVDVTLSDGIRGAHGTAADVSDLLEALVLRDPELAARALSGVVKKVEAGTLDTEVADAVGDALARMRHVNPHLVDSVLVDLGHGAVVGIGRALSEETRAYWDQSLYGDERDAETLVQTGRGEGLEHQGASSAERAASRLVWLQKGVVIDAYGLPVVEGTPGDLTASERVRVVAKLGSDYSGRIRISPQHVAEEPVGDLIEENPELAHLPDENWAPFVPEE
ncbi:MAG: hypothetical protein MI742_14080, partial [Desulfobacterales bacterium]|nr:hypothetical protein [Desulfobacterales bacterium]